jgi:Flp pilus assembly protein protease CpaA
MALAAAGACAVLVVTAGVLLYGAVRDLREYSISNSFVLLLAGLFFLHALLSGRWVTLHENVAFALLMFAILLFCYSKGWLGGGDVKLLTVASLWVGFRCALPFSLFLLMFAALHTMAVKLKWVEGKQIEGRLKIAYAPSINAALIGSFVSGCLVSPDGHFCM